MNIQALVGKTLTVIAPSDDKERIVFECSDGSEYVMFHSQDCCESVKVEDICGDLSDLVGSPIIEAEEVVSQNAHPEGVRPPEYQDESFTWTFYKLVTAKGRVTIRWYGDSNGYYSEDVDFDEIKPAAAN